MAQQLLHILKHHRLAARLAQQSHYFGVAVLAVDKYFFAAVEAGFDAVLKLEYHWAASINQRQVVFHCLLVGARRLAVRPNEHRLVA